MTDRPILFSAPMVRALLEGRKTQTRRIVNAMPPPPAMDSIVHTPRHPAPYFDAYCGGKRTPANPRGMTDHWCWWTRDDRAGHGCKIGYVPGDRLWLREAWRTHRSWDDSKPREVIACSRIWYESDERDNCDQHGRYRHARFMPRWASRLTLTVTDVRVQRLQDISEADAIAEGIEDVTREVASRDPTLRFWKRYRDGGWNGYIDTAIGSYASLWTEINGPGTWEADPWVTAISFDVEQRNIDA